MKIGCDAAFVVALAACRDCSEEGCSGLPCGGASGRVAGIVGGPIGIVGNGAFVGIGVPSRGC
jgi:hypothetical protein